MLLYLFECFDDFYINLMSCLPSLTHTHTHTPAAPFCVKGYLTFSWASSFTRAWPSHRQVFKVFIENIWGRGILADKSFKCSFASQWKNRGEVGVDRKKKNTVRKKEITARGGKGRKRGIVFVDFDSFMSCSVLSESLALGEAVPVHTALVLNKDSISFANAYCRGRECQHRWKHPNLSPPIL